MNLNDNISSVSGVGDKTAQLLSRLKIKTVQDILENYPRRYDDYSNLVKIQYLEPGQVSVKAKVETVKGRYARRGLHITEAVLSDETGKLKAVWFNQPYLSKSIPKNVEVFFSGNFQLSHASVSLLNPVWEKVDEFQKNTARIVPVYRETKGISSKQIRKIVASCLKVADKLENTLPKEFQVLSKQETVQQIHFPETTEALNKAKKALGYEELFTLITAAQLLRREHKSFKAEKITYKDKQTQTFIKSLPFKLTNAQKQTSWQTIKDIDSNQPMNRLLQGDVGSGKTVVAAIAALQVLEDGKQVAVVAPTEILAHQHLKNFEQFFRSFGYEVGLLTGGLTKSQKSNLLNAVKMGDINLVVGTHALFEDNVIFNALGLVVVDEQHRFGVKQRQKLQQNSGSFPHLLSMSATPIPRSLALSVYGDLDVSVIDEMPPNRQQIQTKIVRQSSLKDVYKQIDEQIDQGSQVYVVCPLVEESDKLGVKSVKSEFDRLKETVFAHRKIGLLHGKLNAKDKEDVMSKFSRGELDILISTTVVEVGVDVPNATIMIIEGAERFGLAQLHQLRGRVGRGKKQSYCYLVPTNDQNIGTRLRAMQTTNSGFKLAELDLKLRGPGAIYGYRQHGQLDLRFAEISDTKLISEVQQKVKKFLDREDLSKYPELMKKVITARAVTKLN